MGSGEFFRRVGGAVLEAMVAEANSSPEASPPPLYLYFISAAGILNVLACFRPGEDGFVVLNAGPVVKTGKMVFEADVEWEDQGVRRTGWIHTWAIEGNPMVMFLPDFSSGQFYRGCVTTLPYTPGQPPSGLDQSVGFSRYAIGPADRTADSGPGPAPTVSEPAS